MTPETICKTVRQHNSQTISTEDMKKLLEIAEDYKTVKNHVYARYGGIASLSKIYPGYTVQNEMTASGLRGELELPSVYFYHAIFDALGDIKSQWTRTKTKLLELIGKNEGFSEEDKHYLRFLIRISNAFTAVLNQEPVKLPAEIQKAFEELSGQVEAEKLHRYLRRQVRKYHVKLHTDTADGFSLSERAYRYKDHGIYLSIKEKRKRVFIPLTDSNQYKSQIYVKLYPKEGNAEIHIPVNVTVKSHEEYTNRIGVSAGIFTMLTTHEGHCYGEELGRYQTEYADWLRMQARSYSRNRENNPGRKKYQDKKRRMTEQLHGYINQELNRFLRTEKPQVIYVVKLPKPGTGGINRKINHSVGVWQRGYIRKRLEQKCKEQSIELVEVLGKDISQECSSCGARGSRKDGVFTCEKCGYSAEEKVNSARNVLKRGVDGKVVRI